MAQGVDPELKRQYRKKQTKKPHIYIYIYIYTYKIHNNMENISIISVKKRQDKNCAICFQLCKKMNGKKLESYIPK
jgi:hypothetical protein